MAYRYTKLAGQFKPTVILNNSCRKTPMIVCHRLHTEINTMQRQSVLLN